jgi:hypothetical protein
MCKSILLVLSLFIFFSCSTVSQDVNTSKDSKIDTKDIVIAKIEAESYSAMLGVQKETCSEGGQDVGYIDTGDWMAYPVNVPSAGSYTLQFRVASLNGGGALSVDYNAGAVVVGTVNVPKTAGWQTWTTISMTGSLPAGAITLGIFAKTGGWNFNWFQIVASSSSSSTSTSSSSSSSTSTSSTSSSGTTVKIEAESYSSMFGVQKETTTDTGGGQDVGYIDSGDWMEYSGVNVPAAGDYSVQYRVASQTAKGVIQFNFDGSSKGTLTLPTTGGWQTWATTSTTVSGLTAGTHTIRLAANTGGFNLNWFSITGSSSSSTSTSSSSTSTSSTSTSSTGGPPWPMPTSSSSGGVTGNGSAGNLSAVKAGMFMTFDFVNNTGQPASQVYLTLLCRNKNKTLCWMKPDGSMTPLSTGDNTVAKNGRMCANYSIPLSSVNGGWQLPNYVDSARLFVTIGSILYITVNVDITGQVGYAAPDLNNTSDPDQDVYFDWYEFAIVPATWIQGSPSGFWGNTTYVDQYCISLKADVYNAGNKLLASAGMTKTRGQIFGAYPSAVPAEFKGLVQAPYRINAPCHYMGHGFNTQFGDPYGNYMDSYTQAMWALYRTKTLTFPVDYNNVLSNSVTGKVVGNDFVFTCTSPAGQVVETGTLAGIPTTGMVMLGNGVLDTGSVFSKVCGAKICATLNRHVLDDVTKWYNPVNYYKAAPANYYAAFWHTQTLGGLAYGFCYDDVEHQAGCIESFAPRGVVLTIGGF